MGAILNFADISAGKHVIVADHSMGLLTAAIGIRVSESGWIYQLQSQGVSKKILSYFEGEYRLSSRITDVSLNEVYSTADSKGTPPTAHSFVGLICGSKLRPREPSTLRSYLDQMHKLAVRTLLPGGTLVLCSSHISELQELHANLCRSSDWTAVRLETYFTREYQILPGRTHPYMSSTVSLNRGLILLASKVNTTESQTQ